MFLGVILLVLVIVGAFLRRNALYEYAQTCYYSILFAHDGQTLIEKLYFKSKSISNCYEIPTVAFKMVLLTEKSSLEELGSAQENILSANTLVTRFIQTKYVMPSAYHGTTSSPLRNRSLALLRRYLGPQDIQPYVPRMHEEMGIAFNAVIPKASNTSEWTKLPAHKTLIHILARVVTRLYIGEELCRNEEYINTACNYVDSVLLGGYVLSMMPDFLRPFAEPYLVGVEGLFKVSDRHLIPVVEKRLQRKSQFSEEKKEKKDDFLQWYLDSMEYSWSAKDIAHRFFEQNFETIESTAFLLLYVVLELAGHPDCYEAMKQEVEDTIGRTGTPAFEDIEKMHFMDSFMKEVQRIWPMTSVTAPRITIKPYTFANGTTVNPGEAVFIPSAAIHRNPEFYPNPDEFDPWRFARKRADEDRDENLFVGSGSETLAFGIGKRKCPGRFFASIGIKLTLIHLVRNFELKLEEGARITKGNFQGISKADHKIKLLMRPSRKL
ncbi:hypothetical protein RUND412_002824 [Rhizina undulata]